MHARITSALITVMALLVLAAVMSLAAKAPSGVAGLGRVPGGNEERLEQQLTTEMRLDALQEAKAAGTFGRREPVVLAAAPGWAGEQLMDASTDDWEPAIAADPNAPYVYMLTTRYAPKPCPGNCPFPWMALEISSDGGATWSPGVPLCACKGSWQFDPIIEVVPNTGACLRALHERLQRRLHEVDEPRCIVVDPGQDVRLGVVERQAGPRDEQRRAARVCLVERPERG